MGTLKRGLKAVADFFRKTLNAVRLRAVASAPLTWDETLDQQEAIPAELASRMREATQLKVSASENLHRTSSKLRKLTGELFVQVHREQRDAQSAP